MLQMPEQMNLHSGRLTRDTIHFSIMHAPSIPRRVSDTTSGLARTMVPSAQQPSQLPRMYPFLTGMAPSVSLMKMNPGIRSPDHRIIISTIQVMGTIIMFMLIIFKGGLL